MQRYTLFCIHQRVLLNICLFLRITQRAQRGQALFLLEKALIQILIDVLVTGLYFIAQ